ncbi:MAG: HEAT repeat domain-containing protein, partial [Planctomycetes bacterium]|nr:HEAT repeat domain-containing protein [Planctomycetota bacterium]
MIGRLLLIALFGLLFLDCEARAQYAQNSANEHGGAGPKDASPDRDKNSAEVHRLSKLLDDKSTSLGQRYNAITALTKLGPGAKDAIPALIKALHNVQLRRTAAAALTSIGTDAIPALTALLKNKETKPHAAASAAAVLGRFGPKAKESLPALKTALKRADQLLRITSLHAIIQIDRSFHEGLPIVREALDDENPQTRSTAVIALRWMLPTVSPIEDALPLVRKALDDEQVYIYHLAVTTLQAILMRVEQPRSVLDKFLKDDRFRVRFPAAIELAKLGKIEKRVVAVLCEGLDTKHRFFARRQAIDALRKIGPEAKSAIQPLSKILREAAPGPSRFGFRNGDHAAALDVLRQFGPAAIPALVDALKHGKNRETCQSIGSLLIELGPDAKPSVPQLVEIIKDPDNNARLTAIWVLEAIGPSAQPAVPALIKILQGKDNVERSAALMALEQIGPEASNATPFVIQCL